MFLGFHYYLILSILNLLLFLCSYTPLCASALQKSFTYLDVYREVRGKFLGVVLSFDHMGSRTQLQACQPVFLLHFAILASPALNRFFSYILKICLVCVLGCTCLLNAQVLLLKIRGQFVGFSSFYLSFGCGVSAQVVIIGGKLPYPLSHLTNPSC